jgi:fimbrial chaperone protein
MRGFLRGALAALLATLPSAAGAGQLQAGPTLIEITPAASATRLLLRNTGSLPVAAQVRVYAWSQSGGEDQLVPSAQLVVSPPIVELEPGGEQVVRVVRLGPPASGADQTYRVIVDELPRPDSASGRTVNVRLRYVLPVFVRAADAPPPSLACRVDRERSELTCENSGGRAAQFGATRLVDESGLTQTLSDGLFGYVLPTSRRVWVLSGSGPALGGSALRLETRVNGELATLHVQRRP